MKQLGSLLLALWVFGSPAWAGSPVVVELFTSQGCSSCPPADKLFHEIAKRDDVIALSLHVDYWDYIGWKDEFADPAHAQRQRAYARVAKRRSIYTPEMVVNGETDIVGARPMELAEAILAHKQRPAMMTLTIERTGEVLLIQSGPAEVKGPFVLHMLRYMPTRESRITRGENAGRTLAYANVVEDWRVLGEWDGVTPMDMTTEIVGDKPVVVLVQSQKTGHVIGASRLR